MGDEKYLIKVTNDTFKKLDKEGLIKHKKHKRDFSNYTSTKRYKYLVVNEYNSDRYGNYKDPILKYLKRNKIIWSY